MGRRILLASAASNDEMSSMPEPGVTGTETFVVQRAHTTNVFGPQHAPPGLPAADDVEPEEAVSVLGTPEVLARFEFVGRESVRGAIPDGTGVVGERAEVDHDRPAPVGTELRVETTLMRVDNRRLVFDGEVRRVDTGDHVAGGSVVLHVVDRPSFREHASDG